MMKNIYRFLTLLLVPVLAMISNPVQGQDLASDSLALVDLYNDCGGANWTGYDTWLNGPIGTWEGVTVDSALQRVTHVSFKSMELVGTLPSSLGNMDEMSGKIEFHDDAGLTGTFPSFIWNWTKIERFQLKRSGYTAIDTTGLSNLVNLTEFNTEANSIGGMIPSTLFKLPAMEKLYLHNCDYDQVPPEITGITGLTRLYLNGNNFSDLPDMSGMTWGGGAKVRVQDNALTFEDLEMNMAVDADTNVAEFKYSPQAMVGMSGYMYPATGAIVSLDANVGGTANLYTWIKNDTGVVGSMATYDIASFDPNANSGSYHALVQNSTVTGLEIKTASMGLFSSSLSQDSLALVDLYNNCGGAAWTGFPTWLNGPLNTWEEVTIDSASQRVTHVGFKNMDLSGTLPSSLGNITEMGGKIELHDDSMLTGELPAVLWTWTNMERFQLKRSGITSINTDGMENLVNLTEYNTEANAITGTIPAVLFTLPAMEKLYLHDCEYDEVPGEITQISGLTRLYLNGNNFSSIPDMSGMTWGDGAKIRLKDNMLTFEDLEPNVTISSDTSVAEFSYSPQANVGMTATIDLVSGDTLELSFMVGGSANMYNWIKNDTISVGTDMTYKVDSVGADDVGAYHLLVQSALVQGLDIYSEVQTVTVDGVSSIEDLAYFGEIKVLGNPIQNNLKIEASKLIEEVHIFDLTGKQVKSQTIRSNFVDLSVVELNAGIYFVILKSGNHIHSLKMVK